MTTRRSTTLALALVILGSTFALTPVASAESVNPKPLVPVLAAKEPLWHKGHTVGTGNATITGGDTSIAFTKVFAVFQAPKAGLTWRARVVASYNCATNPEPANGETTLVTHFTEATPWTVTKLNGMSGSLKAEGFSHVCASGTSFYGPFKARLQVAQVGGAIYAASTIY